MFDHVGRSPGVQRGAAATLVPVTAILLGYANHRIASLIVLVGGGTLLAVVARIIDAHRNRSSQGWPTAQAVVESARVARTMGEFPRWLSYVAVLDYAYRTADGYFAGVHYRSFRKEAQAYALVDVMKGKSISVRYDPRDPDSSVLPESELLAVLPGGKAFGKRFPRALGVSD